MTIAFLLALLAIFGCPKAKAAGTCPVDRTLQVGVSTFEPMVVKNSDGSFSGFEIELFESAIKDIGCSFVYEEYTDFTKLLKDVGEGKIDVALGGISITASREMGGIDFTHSFYDSGIAVLARHETSGLGFRDTVVHLWNSPLSKHAGWFVLYLLFIGFGDIFFKTPLGRFITMFIMVSGIPLASMVSGDYVAFALSDAQNAYSVTSLEDLNSKKIATIGGTTSIEVVKNRVGSVTLVKTVEEGYRLLKEKKIDGVVFDLPPLKYHAVRSGGDVAVIPDLLSQEKYGIALPDNTRLRESINGRILTLKEDGRYQKIYTEYFDGH
jgi:polar amino acid transport system substrate-binding protein